jgi:hypothetical protein
MSLSLLGLCFAIEWASISRVTAFVSAAGDMKRFRELVAETRKSHPDDDFFADFESSSLRLPIKRAHYRSYDRALMLLDDCSWAILKKKAIGQYGNERPGQCKQAFFNQLNEAFAYRYLLRKGYEDVRFLEEGKKKSPDIGFLDRGEQCYCEVKTLGISDAEVALRDGHRVYNGAVYNRLNENFLAKLEMHVRAAWSQIRARGENGIVFVVLRFDDFTLDYYRNYREQLRGFCTSRGFERLILKVEHYGNRRICFE